MYRDYLGACRDYVQITQGPSNDVYVVQGVGFWAEGSGLGFLVCVTLSSDFVQPSRLSKLKGFVGYMRGCLCSRPYTP